MKTVSLPIYLTALALVTGVLTKCWRDGQRAQHNKQTLKP
jgi:hypothetical protein